MSNVHRPQPALCLDEYGRTHFPTCPHTPAQYYLAPIILADCWPSERVSHEFDSLPATMLDIRNKNQVVVEDAMHTHM